MSVHILTFHKCTLFKFLAQDSNLCFPAVHSPCVDLLTIFYFPNLPPEACSVLNHDISQNVIIIKSDLQRFIKECIQVSLSITSVITSR